MTSASPSVVRLAFELTERSLPIPTGKIHVVHQGCLAEQTFRVGRSLVSDEQYDIIIYFGDLRDLYEIVPKRIMHTPLGGAIQLRIGPRNNS